jgi:hypothetical protein
MRQILEKVDQKAIKVATAFLVVAAALKTK